MCVCPFETVCWYEGFLGPKSPLNLPMSTVWRRNKQKPLQQRLPWVCSLLRLQENRMFFKLALVIKPNKRANGRCCFWLHLSPLTNTYGLTIYRHTCPQNCKTDFLSSCLHLTIQQCIDQIHQSVLPRWNLRFASAVPNPYNLWMKS